jgi:DGQHR domain-containing protein
MSETYAQTVAENVKLHFFETLEEARTQAMGAAADVSGIVFPCVMFKQGRRILLSGALAIGFIRNRLDYASAPKRGSVGTAQSAMNRPLDDNHSENIAKYLAENHKAKYILPPLTLNVQQNIDVFTTNISSELKSAYVLLPLTTTLAITDGQHRKKAIDLVQKLLLSDDLQYFDRDAVGVMIVCEAGVAQIHQDFADCSKTKPLPPSQLAVYDRRNPANALVLELAERCPLFKDKIDATSSTLGKKSVSLFLANQVRQLVKELLVGSYAEPDETFQANAQKLLKGPDQPEFGARLAWYVEFINTVTEAIPVLREIAQLDTKTQLGKIPHYRAEGWVCLTATGLNVIGRVGHALFNDQKGDWKTYAARLGKIDWARAAPIWQGNIVQSGKLTTQQAPLRAAYRNVMVELGLAPPMAQAA